MHIIKTIFNTIIGFLFGLGSTLALTPAFAAFAGTGEKSEPSALIWIVALAGAALGFFAPTIRRAFGRGFLLLGVCIFVLPLSTMLLSGRVTSDMVAASDSQAATAVGAGIAGVLMTGASAFIGFFLGSVFLLIGLVLALGGRRQVIVVKQ